ncbi:MAG: hypothetical protein GEU73_14255 [Chloroflexi bacterium]|nr:hypothetical protein [Chloroflexota bacterium]
MLHTRARGLIGLVLAWVCVACAAPSQVQAPPSEGAAAPPPKRITAAISGNAFTFYNKFNLGNGVAGIENLEDMVTAGLANYDAHDRPTGGTWSSGRWVRVNEFLARRVRNEGLSPSR